MNSTIFCFWVMVKRVKGWQGGRVEGQDSRECLINFFLEFFFWLRLSNLLGLEKNTQKGERFTVHRTQRPKGRTICIEPQADAEEEPRVKNRLKPNTPPLLRLLRSPLSNKGYT